MAGLEIIQVMESLQHSGVNIYTIANNAASMAFIIHQHGTERYVKPWSILMQHQMSVGMEGQYYNLKAYGDLIDKIHTKLLDKQAKTANTTTDKFDDLTRHDLWLLGDESIERGFADKVVNVMCDFRPETFTEILHTWFGDAQLTFSTCPLSSKPLDVKIIGHLSPEESKSINKQIHDDYDTEGYLKHFRHKNSH